MEIAGRPGADDAAAADWVVAALRDQERSTVASLVPPVFEAYARVFHPAVRYPEDDAEPDDEVSWADVAAFNGRTAHALMQWPSITGSWEYVGQEDQPGMWNDAPAEGHLPSSVASRLAGVLARHTTTPADCWFGVDATVHGAAGPTLTLPDGTFRLVRGPLALAAGNFAREPAEQSPHLWWPADRAWFVATDVGLMSSYVGGSAACIADLLAAEGLEAAPATPGQKVSFDADTINPLPRRD